MGDVAVETAKMGKYYRRFANPSKFNGTVGQWFRLSILMFLLVVFTLGLGMPWAICMLHRWRMNNLVIEGKQVVFYGKGRKLFWRYMGWSILSLLTLGFYSFRVPVKVMDWLMEYTHFELEEGQDPELYYKVFQQKSSFCGVTMDYVRVLILQALLLIFTLGLAMPWVICLWGKWYFDNMIIDGKQVVFAGGGKKLFWRYLAWSILTIITLGIWGFWMAVRILKWEADHIYFG
jgi:uncharacterized membrane protein YjgN (DUF898 family)